jgi:enoyl-CoA hydratase/carnithine racemase
VRAVKRLLNASADADTSAILLVESKEQATLLASPNQIEAVRAGMEGRPGRFVDSE